MSPIWKRNSDIDFDYKLKMMYEFAKIIRKDGSYYRKICLGLLKRAKTFELIIWNHLFLKKLVDTAWILYIIRSISRYCNIKKISEWRKCIGILETMLSKLPHLIKYKCPASKHPMIQKEYTLTFSSAEKVIKLG